MKKRLNKKITIKLRRAIATQPIRVDEQDPAADLPPWQVAMLRRMLGASRAEPIRCGPKPLSLKPSRGRKQVPDAVSDPQDEPLSMEAMSAQLLRLREEIGLSQSAPVDADSGVQAEQPVPANVDF